MSDVQIRAYLGDLDTIGFRIDHTQLGISVDKTIAIRPGNVLIVEMPDDENLCDLILQFFAEYLKTISKETQ